MTMQQRNYRAIICGIFHYFYKI